MKTIRIGMISLAHKGHAYGYANGLLKVPGVEIVGIYDEVAERGQAGANQFKTKFYEDYNALISEVDGVVISSDNSRHHQYAMAAANAGVHILVEKPITTVGEDARELIDKCSEKGLVLQTAFPVRLSTAVHKVKQQIDKGELGDIVAISATNHGKMPGGWFVDPALSGGGAVLDHTVHVVDIMRWMLGSEVKEVYAEMDTRLHDIPVDDCGLLSMEFDNGVVATLDTSWSRPTSFSFWGDVTMRIVGTKGVIHLDCYAQTGELWENGAALTHRYLSWGDNTNQALVAEFVAAVREGRPSFITGLDGLRAAETAWAAYESAKAGKPVAVTHY
ncbi:scyllo-inositol 2-dehydrogenase (NAD(+)) [Paenibacillus solanacearum]|uniref:Scyllo-inositol 2-dehydrogenase (NAD(+)) n=1 Tax=Paenibacillus solanacearum TaxID=2048548 RepID=A0A916K8A4_9BACL|nr:scyllo-inositol 2-dehydrogenase (NAD(+)) [Paenibacillus solanacearum]